MIMDELDVELVRDHVAGVEMQLLEAVEQQHQAETQGLIEEAHLLQGTIEGLHDALAQTADIVADGAAAD